MNRAALIQKFKEEVIRVSSDPSFIHHPWFVKYHLEIVDRIAHDLLAFYSQADKDTVEVLVWLHDYGKAVDFKNEYQATLTHGRPKLLEIGFDKDFTDKLISYIELMDKKMEVDLHDAPIEVQIVSSADGCSHMVGPFLSLWWWENAKKPFEELMSDNRFKLGKDWNRKIVLPEARKAFENRHKIMLEETGEIPDHFIIKS